MKHFETHRGFDILDSDRIDSTSFEEMRISSAYNPDKTLKRVGFIRNKATRSHF